MDVSDLSIQDQDLARTRPSPGPLPVYRADGIHHLAKLKPKGLGWGSGDGTASYGAAIVGRAPTGAIAGRQRWLLLQRLFAAAAGGAGQFDGLRARLHRAARALLALIDIVVLL